MNIELVDRYCAVCGSHFRVMKNDPQQTCSIPCKEKLGEKGRLWNPIKREKNETVGKQDMQTQSIKKNVKENEGKDTIKTKKKKDNESETIMTEKKKQNENENIEETTEKKLISTKDNTMPIVMEQSVNKSTMQGEEEIQQSDSQRALENMIMVQSQSMNLIDDSAQLLFELMKGMQTNRISEKVKYHDPSNVKTATGAAKEIRELLRLKLDVIKTQQQFIKESKNGISSKESGTPDTRSSSFH